MDIARIILRVSDLERAVGFWKDQVGFEVVMDAGAFVFLGSGPAQLVLNGVDEVVEDESLTELVIEVEDIGTAHAEMSDRGVPFEVEPRMVTGDGERELWAAHFRDPDGHLASITGWVTT
ncbi:MAG TPA: VOC family protein [Acidimicrobiia bacterium]|nr:VOC family protein [Acidimicrobiia bacterium]